MISGRLGSFSILVLLLLMSVSLAADGVYETRGRWNAKDFHVTEIDRIGETSGKSAFLVTRGNDRYVILEVSDYAKQKVTRAVRNVETGDYVQMSYTYRSSTTTRSAFLAEAKARKDEQIEHIVFQTNRGQYTSNEAQLYTPEARKALNAIIAPEFGAELQRLQSGLLSYVNLQIVCRTVIAPFTGGQCERAAAPVVRGAKPDCDVDASFGFPCSANQRARSTKAAVHVSTPTRY